MTQLSKLIQITAKIHVLNQQGISVSIEIGKCLEEAKSEFNTSDEWMVWAESEFGYKKSQAYKLIAIAKRFHSSGNSLEGKTINEVYALTVFDEEELETPVQLSSGETKTPLEMNQKEIDQYKRAQAEAERSAQQAQQEAEHYKSLYEKEKDKPAQVVTQTVEKVPDHIGKQIETLKFENTNLKHGYQSAKEKLQQFELRDTVNFDEEQARKEREKLQHEADLNTINIRIAYKQFIEKAAITAFVQGAIAHANPSEKERLTELVDSAQQIIDQTKLALRGRKLGAV